MVVIKPFQDSDPIFNQIKQMNMRTTSGKSGASITGDKQALDKRQLLMVQKKLTKNQQQNMVFIVWSEDSHSTIENEGIKIQLCNKVLSNFKLITNLTHL